MAQHLPLTAALTLSLAMGGPMPNAKPPETPWFTLAKEAAAWIRAQAVPVPGGLMWPAEPGRPDTLGSDLYHGTAGVVWFLLELAAAGEPAVLGDARLGADALLARLDDETDCGLYTGLAGLGFVLRRAHEVTGDERYRQGARRAAARIRERAVRTGTPSGMEWPGQGNDIVSGAAGIGLWLLSEDRAEGEALSRGLARAAGLRLVELGIPEAGGLKWAMDEREPTLMPNFSHGTAGIAYFLATLHAATGEPRFLDAARAGARYLQAVARVAGDAALVFHHESRPPGAAGDGHDLFYWSWCHGPAGTARLFLRLHEVTGDCAFLEWAHKGARAILASGLPESQPPGFWDNVGPCCGHAGIAEALLGLHEETGEPRYRQLADRISAHLASVALCDASGARWVQAEHRARPELRAAQTGYMQGAAGVGMWFLRMDAEARGGAGPKVLPDSPF